MYGISQGLQYGYVSLLVLFCLPRWFADNESLPSIRRRICGHISENQVLPQSAGEIRPVIIPIHSYYLEWKTVWPYFLVYLGTTQAIHRTAWRTWVGTSHLRASWLGRPFHFILWSVSPSLFFFFVILTVALLSDGQNYWRTALRCVCGCSRNDSRRCFVSPGTSDQRGKGSVDITGAQLDFAQVCVLTCKFANLPDCVM